MRILVCEDERITRASLKRQLESWKHQVTMAEDGAQGLELFGDGSGFDIVITDWEMPRVSGVELIERIRATRKAGYVYVIMLTSRSDKADLVRGIEAGADDFVSKPFDREELRVRLLAGQRIVNLERALTKQNDELRLANERIRHGLQAAARVQRAMLPRQNVMTPHVRTAWSYVPTEELAGDAIGLCLIDDRYLVSYVIDVSGHGVPAALLSVTAMRSLEPLPEASSILRDLTLASGLGTVRAPSQVVGELNRRFAAGDNDGRFLTMVLCVLDTQTGDLALSSAGHPTPLLLRGSAFISLPDAGGLPIAIMEDENYEQAVVRLEPGDRFFLFSDGVLEQSGGEAGEQFGQARLCAVLNGTEGVSAEDQVTGAIRELSAWAGGGGFQDDVSLVAVEWLG